MSTPIVSAAGTATGTRITHYTYADVIGGHSYPGDVTSVTDPGGNVWKYTYDTYGDKLTAKTPGTGDHSDSSGTQTQLTRWVYNTATGWPLEMMSGRFTLANPTSTSCLVPAVGCTTYTYDQMGRPEVTTDGDGHTTTVSYDPDGNKLSMVDGDNNTTSYTYDAAEQLTATTRPDGTQTSTKYSKDGMVTDQYDATGADTQYTYDQLGHLASVTDPDGRTTGYTYDAVGNLIVKADPGVSGCTTASTTIGCTIYSYDQANELVSIDYNDPSGNTPNLVNTVYDGDGRRTSETEVVHGSTGANPATVTATWAYDSLGELTSTTDINGSTVGYSYDTRGDQTSIVYPGGAGTVTRAFDADGRVRSISDWAGNTTSYTYYSDSTPSAQSAPTSTGTPVVDTTGYDNAGNVTSITAAQGATGIDSFTYSYDSNNQVASVTSSDVPADNHTYGYNPLQELTGSTSTTGYSYDHADNPTVISTPAQPAVPTVQTFDPANQLTSSSQISLVGAASTSSGTASSTVALPAATTAGDQILVAVTVNNATTVTTPTGYTPVGSYNSGSGSTHALLDVYRRTAQTGDTTVTVGLSAAQSHAVAVVVYQGVNPTNPIDTTTNNATAPGTTVTTPGFTPTQAGDQLVDIQAATATVTAGSYTPPAGYATQTQTGTSFVDLNVADQPDLTISPLGAQTSTFAHSAQLVAAMVGLNPSQTDYTYDMRGNRTATLTPTGATTLAYDQADRLTNYNNTASYTYDSDGQRMTKTVNNTPETFTWDTTTNVPHLLADNTTYYIYDPAGYPLEQINATTTTWYHHDQQGSTRTLTNNTGQTTGTASYDPYGNPTTTGTTTPLGYNSAYTDPETGLQYLQHRYYNTTTAQFLTRDPLDASTLSPYGYTNNNPLNGTDPTGLSKCGKPTSPWDVIGSVVDCLSSGNFGGAAQTAGSAGLRLASTGIKYSAPGELLGAASRWTGLSVGVCINGDVLGIVDISGGGCYYAAPSGQGGITLSGGAGAGAPWGLGFTGGPSVSNAKNLNDFTGPFLYGQVSYGEGPIGGLQGEIGRNSCGRVIGVGSVGIGLGAEAPTPFSGGFGFNDTFAFPSW